MGDQYETMSSAITCPVYGVRRTQYCVLPVCVFIQGPAGGVSCRGPNPSSPAAPTWAGQVSAASGAEPSRKQGIVARSRCPPRLPPKTPPEALAGIPLQSSAGCLHLRPASHILVAPPRRQGLRVRTLAVSIGSQTRLLIITLNLEPKPQNLGPPPGTENCTAGSTSSHGPKKS